MILVAKEDVLRGLKKFKRLAKQDILASGLTSNPEFWSTQAEARRRKYQELMDAVERDGVEKTYQENLEQYARLPFLDPDDNSQPELKGTEQALEMFFTLLGVERKPLREARNRRIPLSNPPNVERAVNP